MDEFKFTHKSKRALWVKVYCEALRSPAAAVHDGNWIRNFATKCANRAIEEVGEIG